MLQRRSHKAQRGAVRRTGVLLLLTLLFLACLVAPPSAQAYFGMITSVDGSIAGTGNWIVTGPTVLEWDVTLQTDNSWYYSYVFYHPVGETSHFILEVSDTFTANDIFNASGDYASPETGLG